ncbi:hypothetical protein BC828DRAFT_343602 [Blastocladiella britannica]|nr:hypothetical protein BC828DRAFT_343602 [Blastocladiella britannica]
MSPPAPPSAVPLEAPRLHRLPCNKSVIVASDAHRFLAWAATKFEVAVCSLGEQLYVDQVCAVLDPAGTLITGPRFSARQEYNWVSKNGTDRAAVLRKPVKTLASMYAFAAPHPLHSDDQYRPWPTSHHDSIILVDRNRQDVRYHAPGGTGPPPAPWDVSLFPVVASLLDRVHAAYFGKLEEWLRTCEAAIRAAVPPVPPPTSGSPSSGLPIVVVPPGFSINLPSPPTAVMCYKQLLKEVIREQIAMGPRFSVTGFWDGGAANTPKALAAAQAQAAQAAFEAAARQQQHQLQLQLQQQQGQNGGQQ